ncbi:hypothetical protein QL285_060630 [Trifolium repens]|nr:hypothetical protein QL285_060630 [Trifolium repens]
MANSTTLISASISLIRDFTLKFSIESSKSFTPNPKSVFVLQIHINIGGSQIRRTSSSSSAVQASFNFKLHSSSSSGFCSCSLSQFHTRIATKSFESLKSLKLISQIVPQSFGTALNCFKSFSVAID